MKDKLIKLYKIVAKSDKTVVRNHFNNLATNDEIYYTGRKFEITKKKEDIFAEIEIISTNKNDIYKTLTYRDTSYGNFYYDKDKLDNYYNGHELEPTAVADLPMGRAYATSIAFTGNIPNIVVYMSSSRKNTESKEVILDKSEWTVLGKKLITSKFDVKLTYHINFGSVTEKITEKEYKELIGLAKDGINRSHELMVDNLLKDFDEKGK